MAGLTAQTWAGLRGGCVSPSSFPEEALESSQLQVGPTTATPGSSCFQLWIWAQSQPHLGSDPITPRTSHGFSVSTFTSLCLRFLIYEKGISNSTSLKGQTMDLE